MSRIPFVAQMTASECPVACLAMVLAYHGRAVPRSRVRSALIAGRDGASAHDLLVAARAFGLAGRGVRRPPGDTRGLAAGTILHWNAKHFVVLECAAQDHSWILDPAAGRRRVDLATLRESFRGLALEFSVDAYAPSTPEPCTVASPSADAIRRRARRPSFLVPMVLDALVSILLAIGGARMMWEIIARIAAPDPRFGELAIPIAGLAVATVAVRISREWRLHAFSAALERELGTKMMAQLLRVPLTFYRHRSSADIYTRLSGVHGTSQRIARGLAAALIDVPVVVAYIGVLLWWNTTMAFAAVLLVSAYVAATVLLRRAQEHRDRTVLAGEKESRRFEVQAFEQIALLKAAGSEPAVEKIWARLARQVERSAERAARSHARGSGVLDGISALIPLALLAVGGHEVVRGGSSLPAMIGANCLAGALLRPLYSVTSVLESRGPIRQALERIDDVMLEPLPDRSSRAATIGAPARITLDAVTVSIDGIRVLDDVTLELEPARHIAIIGAPRSGKSVLAAVLGGLQPPDAGRVAIAGHDLAELALGERTTYIVQPSLALFDGCIYDNIALVTATVTHDDVRAAARIAGAHDEIEALPLGYRTPVIDGGKNLSDALRRRLLLARALLEHRPWLILDGAAAAVGADAEGQLIDAVLALADRAVVTVTDHRSTIERADLVVVLERGRLVDSGPPALLQSRCTTYRELVSPDRSEPAAPPPYLHRMVTDDRTLS